MPESSTILFGCPHCQRRLSVNARASGRNLACPDCKKQLVVPASSESAPIARVPASSEPVPIARRASAVQVFISYSTKDKQWANAACAALEGLGIGCWIAPRDIPPGAEWGAAIIGGIDACKVMVLVFSTHANDSPQVRREVERAINKGLVIVPLRVENANPSGAMEYALSNTHWLDASAAPQEQTVRELAYATKALLQGDVKPARVTTKLLPPLDSAARPAPKSRRRWLRSAATLLMLIALAGVGVGGWQLISPGKNEGSKKPLNPIPDKPDPFEEDFSAVLKRGGLLPKGWVPTDKVALQPDQKGRASLQVILKEGEHFATAQIPYPLTGDFSMDGELRLKGASVLKISLEARKGGAPLLVTFRQGPWNLGSHTFVSINNFAECLVPNFKWDEYNIFRIRRKEKAGQVLVNDEPLIIANAPLPDAEEYDTIRIGLTAGAGWLYHLKVSQRSP